MGARRAIIGRRLHHVHVEEPEEAQVIVELLAEQPAL